MTLTAPQLQAAMPKITPENVTRFLGPINDVISKYQIDTAQRLSCFLAQLAHESVSLSRMEEGLSYSSADRLCRIFPKHFPTQESALPYVRQPEKLANKVYANRMGNGDTTSGDGYRYRGRGPMQLTGKSNYAWFARETGADAVNNPDLVKQPDVGMLSAGWFWNVRALNPLADAGDMLAITRKINGGTNGLEDRLHNWTLAKKALGL